MIIDLAKRANEIDESLSIIVSSDENMYSLGVYSEGIGTLYSFSSTEVSEAYSKVNKFLDCLTSQEKFDNFMEDILETSLEE